MDYTDRSLDALWHNSQILLLGDSVQFFPGKVPDVVSNEKVVQGTGSQMLASFLHDDSLSRSNPTSSTPVSHLSAFPGSY